MPPVSTDPIALIQLAHSQTVVGTDNGIGGFVAKFASLPPLPHFDSGRAQIAEHGRQRKHRSSDRSMNESFCLAVSEEFLNWLISKNITLTFLYSIFGHNRESSYTPKKPY